MDARKEGVSASAGTLHGQNEEAIVPDKENADRELKQTSGGLLTAMVMGGSLHSEEKPRDRGRKPLVVEYPQMIWKGDDICVLQKPADWICSASDVDKKKGRKLDPNEDLRNKGFKVMKDLLDFKFAEREKKYIHWWIQLMHEADREQFPNLFDVDQNYGLCHRLDRETSGTVLVGVTKKSRTQMRECFHRHYVRKLCERGDWMQVQSEFGTYAGQAALESYPLNEVLAAARIDAAAAEGDVQAAAQMLDDMDRESVKINIAHINSAIRTCWNAEGAMHSAAKYLFDLIPGLCLTPDIVTFTCLVGAYTSAELSDIQAVYAKIKDVGVEVDKAFAEVYLFTVLRMPASNEIGPAGLSKLPNDRIRAAMAALKDFNADGLELTRLSCAIERALHKVEG
ncbi:PPR4 [Symbiodinium sp. KB8]|nr:PPR4 [Symbiodinium sp. KB8]